MLHYIKGFIVEITKWDMANARSRVINDMKFIVSDELHLFRKFLLESGYNKPNDALIYKIDQSFIEVIHLKTLLPKSYLFRDDSVWFWGKPIDIIKMTDTDLSDYIEDIEINIDKKH